ncbi:MAG: saccharopine dehydrogenase (NAD+, L-lysine-forming), partial [Limisphaerales bacterium]
AGISLQEDMMDRDVLLGVKEVPKENLLADKTYFFFSHTIKAQPYNRSLLQTILAKKIRLVDWETLTNEKGQRVIAFGRWAGIVGAHNGLWTWGKRTEKYSLPRANSVKDFAELKSIYKNTKFSALKIVLTGGGRVAGGAKEVLDAAGITQVSKEEFLATPKPSEAIYIALDCPDFYQRKTDQGFDWQEFFKSPELYEGTFAPYSKAADLLINAIYWDPAAPVFFTAKDMAASEFRIRTIADITCDINGSVPSTTRATTIADPLYGFNVKTGDDNSTPHGEDILDVMSIDNLPNELPRDASAAFGEQFSTSVWPELQVMSSMIDRASIAVDGALGKPFNYLQDFVDGE